MSFRRQGPKRDASAASEADAQTPFLVIAMLGEAALDDAFGASVFARQGPEVLGGIGQSCGDNLGDERFLRGEVVVDASM